MEDMKISQLPTATEINGNDAIPIVQNGITKKMPFSALVDIIYPIGSIYMSINNTDPSNFLGGTWEVWAKGKTLVGVDVDDTDFNTAEKEIGAKTKSLPNHNHNYRIGIPYYYGEVGGEKTENCGVFDYSTNKYAGFSNDNNIDTLVNNSTSNSNKDVNARIQKSEGKTSSAGSADINVIQPSITCYMFKRVS